MSRELSVRKGTTFDPDPERDGIKQQIGRIFADNNVVGFATYGEHFNSMHVNQTFTGIAIGQPA